MFFVLLNYRIAYVVKVFTIVHKDATGEHAGACREKLKIKRLSGRAKFLTFECFHIGFGGEM